MRVVLRVAGGLCLESLTVAQKKAPLAGPSRASKTQAIDDRQAAAADKCQFLGMITVSIA